MSDSSQMSAEWTVEEIFDPQSARFATCPYDAYAKSRGVRPVAHHQGFDEWIVTGRAELHEALRDSEALTSRHNLDGHVPLAAETRQVLDRTLFFQPALYNVAGPEHARFRAFITEYFAPRRLREMEPSVRAIAENLVAGFAADGQADLLRQFAYPLPYTVISDVLGIPDEDRATVKEWNNAWLALQVVPLPAEQQAGCAEALLAYETYLRDQLLSRAENPAEDLLGGLYRATTGNDPLCTVDQAVVSARFMIAAGHETTTNLIGNAVHQLLTTGDLWRDVVRDPELIGAAVEETLRFDSSVQGALRVATREVRIGETVVPAGGRVRVMFAAAGRDPAWVDDADTFRLDRTGAPRHIGFGHGVHFCVGAPLARMETRVAIETLARVLPGLRLAPGFEPRYLPGGFIFHALETLPVAWPEP